MVGAFYLNETLSSQRRLGPTPEQCLIDHWLIIVNRRHWFSASRHVEKLQAWGPAFAGMTNRFSRGDGFFGVAGR